MTKLNFYPTTEDLKVLSKPTDAGYAVSLYRTFQVSEHASWVDQIVSQIRHAVSAHGFRRGEAEAAELKHFLEENLKGIKLERPSVAVFTDGTQFHFFNTYSRMTDEVVVSKDRFSVRQLLRTVSASRRAAVLSVQQYGWDIYQYEGPEPSLKLSVDKENFASLEEFTEQSVEKHVTSRNLGDLAKEHRIRYAGKIANVFSRHIRTGQTVIIVGEARLAHEVRNHLKQKDAVYVKERSPASVAGLDAIVNSVLDEQFVVDAEKKLNHGLNLVSSGAVSFDLSDAMRRAFIHDVETLIVGKDCEVYGTLNDETGQISYDGNEPLVSHLIARSLLCGAEVIVLRSDELADRPEWNGEIVLIHKSGHKSVV